jgi:phosphoribosylanthranilate isomerase
VLLAGGLKPESVAGTIKAAGIFGVDVASGVELAPGIKDKKKVVKFVREAKRALKP